MALEIKRLVVYLKEMTIAEMDRAGIPPDERPGPEETFEDDYGAVVLLDDESGPDDQRMVTMSEATLHSILKEIPGFKDYALVDTDNVET